MEDVNLFLKAIDLNYKEAFSAKNNIVRIKFMNKNYKKKN